MKTEIHKRLRTQATYLIVWERPEMNHLCWVISKPESHTECLSWLSGLGEEAHEAEPWTLPYFSISLDVQVTLKVHLNV